MTSPRWRPLTEGGAIILPLLVAGIVAARLLPPAAPVALLAAAGIALAFRDPDRAVEPQPGVALAPGDGRVIHLGQVHDDYWKTDLTEIVIFLSLLDVHVQRAPLDGLIVAQRRRTGGYRPAMSSAATHGNNQLATYLQTEAGPCTVTQISGLVARRIVMWCGEGDRLAQSQRMGMIKFSSQVTLRVPLAATVLVQVGDHVRAGVTPVARLTPA